MDWAISSEASLETKMNVQRLLKSPKDSTKIPKKEGDDMESKERVNQSIRRRAYGARDKEE